MPADMRDRILRATYACVARSGLAKTTIEDAAREAGVSRATVYRHFPGGRDQLLADVIAWETGRFFRRLADAVADADGVAELLEEGLRYAHRAVADHEVLQKVFRAEPERLLPPLTVEAGRILPLLSAFVAPHLAKLGGDPGDTTIAADYVARMVLSFIGSPGRWDLTDAEQVRTLVRTELLAGVGRRTPP